jgi:hypothetical protein
MSDARVSPMGAASTACLEHEREEKLPRRDWILLPLIAFLTIGAIGLSTESISKWMCGDIKSSMENCLFKSDPSGVVRAIPNSICLEKPLEGDLFEYKFNSCGHRAGMECGPKPPGTYRIVMVGASFGLGARMQRERTFAALLPEELSSLTGRKVELYNESMAWGSPQSVALRFDEVVAAKPDLILWILTPWDIQSASPAQPGPATPEKRVFLGGTARRLKELLARKSFLDATPEILDALHYPLTRFWTGYMLEHYLYESQSQYVRLYMTGDDDQVGFLRVEPSERWRKNVADFAADFADIQGRANAAGVPLVATFVPSRAQAAMISMGEWPASCDPYKLDKEARAIAISNGATFIDILPGYRNIPNPERGYLPMDGHPNAEGHRVISGLLANQITSGAVPALQVATKPQMVQGRGR